MTTDLNMAMKGFASFTNPWEGQGTDIGEDGPTSNPDQGSGGWWENWGRDVVNSIPDYLDSLGGLFSGGRQNGNGGTPPSNQGQPPQPGGGSWMFIGMGVLVVILILFILLKK